MRSVEYLISLGMALLLVGAMVTWTQASQSNGETALSCRPGRAAQAVVLKGMSIYPRCSGVAKRG
jgi:hypothetical protein